MKAVLCFRAWCSAPLRSEVPVHHKKYVHVCIVWWRLILSASFTVSNQETDKVEIELFFCNALLYLYSYLSVLFTARKQRNR